MNPTTDVTPTQHLVTTMTEQFASLTRALSSWMLEQLQTLTEVEHQVLRLLKQLGADLLAGLCTLAAPAQPEPTLPCACGQRAHYQRWRTAQVTTLLGPIRLRRPYYLCPSCGHGQHPLDNQLQLCAGSRSAALDELLALLGATQDSFVQAAQVLERLTLVHVSATSVRQAIEQLGAVLLDHQAQPLVQRPPSAELGSSMADSRYAALELLAACSSLPQPVTIVTRLRLDAALYEPVPAREPGKRGAARKKGARQPTLSERLCDAETVWEMATVRWYGGVLRQVELASGTLCGITARCQSCHCAG